MTSTARWMPQLPCRAPTRLVLRDLVGIRRSLFNDAPPYRPLPPPDGRRAFLRR
jgi:hypothetical protein